MKKQVLCLLLWSAPAAANDLPGELYDLGAFDRLEASGVSYFRGRLAVVDDTLNSLFVFDARGQWIATFDSDRLPVKQAKFEDLAFHPGTRTFFAVGAHSGWDVASLEQLSVLVEFRLASVDGLDGASVRRLPLRAAFESLGLWKPQGMKIEGLAVDGAGETLFVGLREPVDRARIYAVSLASLRRGEPVAALYVEFDAGLVDGTPFCVSALTWDPGTRGLFIATSTEQEPSHRFLGNRLWFMPPAGGAAARTKPVMVWDRFDEGMKAEGLTIGARKLFIVYDNDQDDTEIPSRVRVVPLDAIHASLEPALSLVTN